MYIYIYISHITEFVSIRAKLGLHVCLRINDSGLFAWISLTALSRLCLRMFAWISLTGLFAWISVTALYRSYVYGFK